MFSHAFLIVTNIHAIKKFVKKFAIYLAVPPVFGWPPYIRKTLTNVLKTCATGRTVIHENGVNFFLMSTYKLGNQKYKTKNGKRKIYPYKDL